MKKKLIFSIALLFVGLSAFSQFERVNKFHYSDKGLLNWSQNRRPVIINGEDEPSPGARFKQDAFLNESVLTKSTDITVLDGFVRYGTHENIGSGDEGNWGDSALPQKEGLILLQAHPLHIYEGTSEEEVILSGAPILKEGEIRVTTFNGIDSDIVREGDTLCRRTSSTFILKTKRLLNAIDFETVSNEATIYFKVDSIRKKFYFAYSQASADSSYGSNRMATSFFNGNDHHYGLVTAVYAVDFPKILSPKKWFQTRKRYKKINKITDSSTGSKSVVATSYSVEKCDELFSAVLDHVGNFFAAEEN